MPGSIDGYCYCFFSLLFLLHASFFSAQLVAPLLRNPDAAMLVHEVGRRHVLVVVPGQAICFILEEKSLLRASNGSQTLVLQAQARCKHQIFACKAHSIDT